MKPDIATKEYWIMAQLAGIQLMEQELKGAFEKPNARTAQDLRLGLAQLNSWVNAVEGALTAGAIRPAVRVG